MIDELRLARAAVVEQVVGEPAAARMIAPGQADVRVNEPVLAQVDAGAGGEAGGRSAVGVVVATAAGGIVAGDAMGGVCVAGAGAANARRRFRARTTNCPSG